MRNTCAADFVTQIIWSLNNSAKTLEKISTILKIDFIYLGLNKKSIKELRAGHNKYIKTVSFTKYFYCFSDYKLPNLVNKIK